MVFRLRLNKHFVTADHPFTRKKLKRLWKFDCGRAIGWYPFVRMYMNLQKG